MLRFTFVCLVLRGLSEEMTFQDKGKPWLKTQWRKRVCVWEWKSGQHSWSLVTDFTRLILNLNRHSFEPLPLLITSSVTKWENAYQKQFYNCWHAKVFDRPFFNFSLKSYIGNKRKNKSLCHKLWAGLGR